MIVSLWSIVVSKFFFKWTKWLGKFSTCHQRENRKVFLFYKEFNFMPTLKGIIVFQLILHLIIHGKINDKSNSGGTHKKSTDAKHACAMCRAWRECRTCHNMFFHKNATGRKKICNWEKKKCAKPLKIQKGGIRSCLPSLGNFQRASPSLLPLHMHTH